MRFPAVLSLWFAVWGEAQTLRLYRAGTLPHDRRYRGEMLDLACAITGHAATAARFATQITAFTFGLWLDHHLEPDAYDRDGNMAAALCLIDSLRPHGDTP